MKKVSLALFLTTAIAFQGSALADNKEQCKKKGKACKNIRAKVDTNKNGLIDKDEVSGWAQILADKYADKKSSPSQKKCQNKKNRRLDLASFDKDQNSVIDIHEVEALSAKLQERVNKMNAQILAKVDTNKDGKISEEERTAAKAKHKAQRQKRRKMQAAAKLRFFDSDQNGKLSATEIADLQSNYSQIFAKQQERQALKKKFDLNQDGKLSKEERSALKAHFKEIHKKKREEATK